MIHPHSEEIGCFLAVMRVVDEAFQDALSNGSLLLIGVFFPMGGCWETLLPLTHF
jgi:hypothetical protein